MQGSNERKRSRDKVQAWVKPPKDHRRPLEPGTGETSSRPTKLLHCPYHRNMAICLCPEQNDNKIIRVIIIRIETSTGASKDNNRRQKANAKHKILPTQPAGACPGLPTPRTGKCTQLQGPRAGSPGGPKSHRSRGRRQGACRPQRKTAETLWAY